MINVYQQLAKTIHKQLKVCSCLKYWLTLPRKNFIALCWICYKLLMFLLVYTVEPSYNEDPVVMKNICKSSRIIVKYVETNLAVTNSTITHSQNKIYILMVPMHNLSHCNKYFVRLLTAVSKNDRFE